MVTMSSGILSTIEEQALVVLANFSHGRMTDNLTDNREDNNAREHRREAVRQADHNGIAITIIVDGVVRREGDQAAEGQSKGKENLRPGLQPDNRISQRVPL